MKPMKISVTALLGICLTFSFAQPSLADLRDSSAENSRPEAAALNQEVNDCYQSSGYLDDVDSRENRRFACFAYYTKKFTTLEQCVSFGKKLQDADNTETSMRMCWNRFEPQLLRGDINYCYQSVEHLMSASSREVRRMKCFEGHLQDYATLEQCVFYAKKLHSSENMEAQTRACLKQFSPNIQW